MSFSQLLTATLKKDHITTALTSGLIIYGGCILGALTKAPPILLLFTYALPGLLFGIVLGMTSKSSTGRQYILITLISILVYSFSIYIADIPNRIDFINVPSKIIIASTIGAVLLTISYDLLVNKDIELRRTFVNPLLFGILASVLSAFSAHKIDDIPYNEEGLAFVNQLGLYSIFPIWQVLFMINRNIRPQKSSS